MSATLRLGEALQHVAQVRRIDLFYAFIASAICQASTSLIATVSNSSSFPSSFRKS